MTELFQFVNGTFVPTNLPVPVLAEPLRVIARESTKKHALRAETSNGLRRVETTGDSRDGQNLFDGSTYSPRLDEARLTGQLQRVRDLMSDGVWRTLSDISKALGDPESSVSARLRDLRKPRFGMFTVERRRKNKGTWEYRLCASHEKEA